MKFYIYFIFFGACLAVSADPSIAQLEEQLWHPDSRMQKNAVELLSKRGADAVPVLILALDISNPEVRNAAAEALGKLGSDASFAVPVFIQNLVSWHSDVRESTVLPK